MTKAESQIEEFVEKYGKKHRVLIEDVAWTLANATWGEKLNLAALLSVVVPGPAMPQVLLKTGEKVPAISVTLQVPERDIGAVILEGEERRDFVQIDSNTLKLTGRRT